MESGQELSLWKPSVNSPHAKSSLHACPALVSIAKPSFFGEAALYRSTSGRLAVFIFKVADQATLLDAYLRSHAFLLVLLRSRLAIKIALRNHGAKPHLQAQTYEAMTSKSLTTPWAVLGFLVLRGCLGHVSWAFYLSCISGSDVFSASREGASDTDDANKSKEPAHKPQPRRGAQSRLIALASLVDGRGQTLWS